MKYWKQTVVSLLFICLLGGCKQGIETEKHYSKFDKVVNVRDQIQAINFDEEEVIFSSNAFIHLMGDYLLIGDHLAQDKYIHLFDKNDFRYITSTAPKGEGPEEVGRLGNIGINEKEREFYVIDHAKYRLYSYHIDSVTANPQYIHIEKAKLKDSLVPVEYTYISDTLSIGWFVTPIGNGDFHPDVGKWNMLTGEIQLMEYQHPNLKKKRINFDVSMEHGIYVECQTRHDLMSICTLDGKLKCNVYGPQWTYDRTSNVYYNLHVGFCGDKILAFYSGGDYDKEYYPTKIQVFDVEGNYLKTLETGYNLISFCYDKDNNRIILNMNDEILTGYLNLDGII